MRLDKMKVVMVMRSFLQTVSWKKVGVFSTVFAIVASLTLALVLREPPKNSRVVKPEAGQSLARRAPLALMSTAGSPGQLVPTPPQDGGPFIPQSTNGLIGWDATIPGGGAIPAVANVAALAALSTNGFTSGQLVFVEAPPSYYVWYPSSAPAGSSTVAGSTGIYAYLSGGNANEIQAYPLGVGTDGGVQDDWPSLHAIEVAAAGAVPVRLMPGTWHADSIQPIPSGTTLLGSPEVEIVAALHGQSSGTAQVAAITANVLTTGASLTLAADVVAGTSQITTSTTDSGSLVGSYVQLLNSDDHGGLYLVQSTSLSDAGAGLILQLDRPVYFTYPIATATLAVVSTLPTDITVLGGGMHLTGTGAWWIAFSGALRVTIDNIVFDTTGGVPVDNGGGIALFDTTTLDSTFSRLYSTSANPTIGTGLFLAGVERTKIVDCVIEGVTNASAAGATVNLSADSDVSMTSNGNRSGLQIVAGNSNVRWSGTYTGNAVDGVDVDGTAIAGSHATLSANLGVGFNPSVVYSACTNPTLEDARLNGNYGGGLSVGNCTGFRGTHLDLSNNYGSNVTITTSAVDAVLTSYDASSTFPLLYVKNASNTSPIVITCADSAGNASQCAIPVGGTVNATIAGVGGNTAANGNLTCSYVTPGTCTLDANGNGAYTSGGTMQIETGTGILAEASSTFYTGIVRGNFGAGSAITNATASTKVTFDGLSAELGTLPTSTFGMTAAGAITTVQNSLFDLECTQGCFLWTIDGTPSYLTVESSYAYGSAASTEGAGTNNSGIVTVGLDVNWNNVRDAFRFFGGGQVIRESPTNGAAYNVAVANVLVTNAGTTLSDSQYSFPKMVWTGNIDAGITVTFPNLPGNWIVDPSQMKFQSGAGLTLASGSGSVTIGQVTNGPTLCIVSTTGNNTIATTCPVAQDGGILP
jgi:hypothetical protein